MDDICMTKGTYTHTAYLEVGHFIRFRQEEPLPRALRLGGAGGSREDGYYCGGQTGELVPVRVLGCYWVG